MSKKRDDDQDNAPLVPAAQAAGMLCYVGVPTEVVDNCEHIYGVSKVVRLEALRRIRDLLAPYGSFKQWCIDHEENYGSVQYMLSQAYGTVGKRAIEKNSIGGLLEGPRTEEQTIIQAQAERVRVLEAQVKAFEGLSAAELKAEAERREEEELRTGLWQFIHGRMLLNQEKTGDPFHHKTATTEPGKILDHDPTLEAALAAWREKRPGRPADRAAAMHDLEARAARYADRFEPSAIAAAEEEDQQMDNWRFHVVQLAGMEAALMHWRLYHGLLAANIRRVSESRLATRHMPGCSEPAYPNLCAFAVWNLGNEADVENIREQAAWYERCEQEAVNLGLVTELASLLDPRADGAAVAAAFTADGLVDAAISAALTYTTVQRLWHAAAAAADESASE